MKAENAFAAGAVGVIIFNEGQEGRQETLAATLGFEFDDPIPVVGTSFEIGNELATSRLMHRLRRRPPAEAEADYHAHNRDGQPAVHT